MMICIPEDCKVNIEGLNLLRLKQTLGESGINFFQKFEDKHDRFIQTDTGWKIVLGKGVRYFS